jgi:hypothetical protein
MAVQLICEPRGCRGVFGWGNGERIGVPDVLRVVCINRSTRVLCLRGQGDCKRGLTMKLLCRWAAGVTLFELSTGKIMFQGGSNNHMLKLIQEVPCRCRHIISDVKIDPKDPPPRACAPDKRKDASQAHPQGRLL